MMTDDRPMDCAWCGKTNPHRHGEDANDDLAPGDVAVCWGCVHLSVFTGVFLRRPTPEETATFRQDPLIQAAIRNVVRSRAHATADLARRP